MEKIEVYADFFWLKEVELIGFPSRKGDYDVERWEHLCHLLAVKAGINAASTNVVVTNDNHCILLSKRFDRTGEGKRIHKDWTLSPAYDMNPTLNEQQTLLISASSCQSDLRVLSDASEEYMLNKEVVQRLSDKRFAQWQTGS